MNSSPELHTNKAHKVCFLRTQADTFGGTFSLLHELQSLGISHTKIDQTDPDGWQAALRPNTKVGIAD